MAQGTSLRCSEPSVIPLSYPGAHNITNCLVYFDSSTHKQAMLQFINK